MTLSLTEDGDLILQDTKISFQELIPKLKAIASERKDDRIFFRADGANNYNLVMQVMGALSGAGFPDISLVTDTK